MNSLNIIYALFIGITFLLNGQLKGQAQPYDLFADDEPIQVELRFDFKQLLKTKYKEPYLPASFKANLENGETISADIKIRARGNSRKNYCQFPPIKLNFKQQDGLASNFPGQTTLKLVTPCRTGKTFQQYIYSEYLAYKIFNQISDISFKVRLVELNYIDSQGKRKPMHMFGFLIEHLDQCASRNGSREVSIKKMSQKQVSSSYMTKVAIFQYAIGNTDWLVENGHNVKFLQLNDFNNQQFYAVPYDFDYAGLVNTIYAVPHDRLGLESVKERLYRGLCPSSSELEEVFDLFSAKKEYLFGLINDFEQLSDANKRHMKHYLKGFYDIIESPLMVKNRILGYCVK